MNGKEENIAPMVMTEAEFEVLDELYFVLPFAKLARVVDYDEENLLEILSDLHRKGWINCYSAPMASIAMKKADIRNLGKQYFYLATREGLRQHNS